ncbi:hypothetical protein CK203_117794 [Vitis vinifera]|uniref:P-type ATPase N-terminal domain-containing protein n=1 Tax=Vitis vinifera TaxID=29760 RepID=A0A438DJJ0_VITVI|nr:hypothetical protein CK203_117794 [Vitis vinifera]
MVLDSNPATDNTLNLPGVGCCGVVSTPRRRTEASRVPLSLVNLGNSISTTKYSVFTFLPKGLFEQVTASMPCALSQGDCLGIASLKSPCLGLQKATLIYPAWPDSLGDSGDRL